MWIEGVQTMTYKEDGGNKMSEIITKEQAAEIAVEYKHNGYNCSQAVIKGLANYYDVNADELHKMAAGFGVGMGTMGATCGALVGANIFAGMKTEGQRTMMKAKELFNEFESSCGASVCKDLKGFETGKVICSCDDCVRNAVMAAVNVLDY